MRQDMCPLRQAGEIREIQRVGHRRLPLLKCRKYPRRHGTGLLKQLAADQHNLREAAPAPAKHGMQNVQQLAAVERAIKIAAKAVGEHKPRILFGHVVLYQVLIIGKQGFHVCCIGLGERVVQPLRHIISGRAEIDITPGFHREGCEPEFNHELLYHNRNILECEVEADVLHHGVVTGAGHFLNQAAVLFLIL